MFYQHKKVLFAFLVNKNNNSVANKKNSKKTTFVVNVEKKGVNKKCEQFTCFEKHYTLIFLSKRVGGWSVLVVLRERAIILPFTFSYLFIIFPRNEKNTGKKH